MYRNLASFRLALLTAAALAVAAPAFAQQQDPDFTNTLRELNSDIDYSDLFGDGGDGGSGRQPAGGQAPVQGRTYADPGQTRGSAADQDIEATKSTENSLSEQQLIDTVRGADRITQ